MSEAPRTIQCSVTEGFAQWMSTANGTLIVSTYQAGKVVMLGWNGRQVSILTRDFAKPMGLAVSDDELAVACQYETVLLANARMLAPHYPAESVNRFDALFLPRATHITGDLSIHDLAYGDDGLWLVNTRFSCLCVLSRTFSVEPRWHPPFISILTPEDRCHLNGLAMQHGRPRFVTTHGTSDEPGGWRADRDRGGAIIDVPTGEPVSQHLCMPHSPRLAGGKAWVLNSGRGELCQFDPDSGQVTLVCAMQGYVRGLCFVDHYALVGLSRIRSSHVFEGLPIEDRFDRLYCGVAVVDLDTGRESGMFEFTDGCEELYDVQFIPSLPRPSILNPSSQATHRAITAPDFSYWLQPKDGSEEKDHTRRGESKQ